MRPTIHFAFTRPLGANLARRAVDKGVSLAGLPPLYRRGWDPLISWQHPIRSVHAISYNLLHTFKNKGYPVRFYSLYEECVAKVGPDDIFIGLPVPRGGMGATRPDDDEPCSVTSRTIREHPHNKNFIIMPYSHDPTYAMWTKALVKQNAEQGGGAIFIGGKIWEDNWERSPYADITPLKKIHVAMGIDPNDYPRVKTHFNPKGKRRYIYIGHTSWYKNTEQLERIASAIPGFEGLHIGGGHVRGWENRSFASLTPEFMTGIAEAYDIFVNTSIGDPQATTILEQMCFGLVVACTPETGYAHPSLVMLSTSDTEKNVQILQGLQYADEEHLLRRADQNRATAIAEHSWEKFCSRVVTFMGI